MFWEKSHKHHRIVSILVAGTRLERATLGYEPSELPTAPSRDVVCECKCTAKN